MRYNKYGAKIISQEVLEPHNRINIKTVGRLIEKNDVRIAKECLCKKHFDLFALLERRHHHIKIVIGKTESLNKLRGVRFRLPAVELCELAL